MNYLTKSPLKSNYENENIDYIQYINKTPNYILFKNYCHHCHCHCHCHSFQNKLHHDITYSRIYHNYPLKLNLEQEHKYHHPLRNKSANNLFISYNKNSFEKLNKANKTNPNINENANNQKNIENDKKNLIADINNRYVSPKINNKDNLFNSYLYNYDYGTKKNKYNDISKYYNNKISSSYGNNLYSYLNNLNNNKKEKKYIVNNLEAKIKHAKSFHIKRKGLSQYFHVNPKKYSYGGEILETTNTTKNHQYKEVFATSNSKDKVLQKSVVINYNNYNNNENISNKDNLKSKNNIKDHKYINQRYNSFNNSPKNLSRNFTFQTKESKTELKPKIIHETNNTKYVELKEIKNVQTEKYLYKPNDVINYNSYINNNYNTNNNSNDFQNHNLYANNNNINLNSKTNQFQTNKYQPYYNYKYSKENTSSNINNIKKIPKSYSVSSINNYKNKNNNVKTNIKNEYDNDLSNIYDYETIKKKVKLALLQKQLSEKQKQKTFNNGKNQENLKNKKYLEKFLSKGHLKPDNNNFNNINNSLYPKTNKLLEDQKLKNIKKNLIILNNKNNDNKMLYSLKNNFRGKKNDYTKNKIKNKLKIWKP